MCRPERAGSPRIPRSGSLLVCLVTVVLAASIIVLKSSSPGVAYLWPERHQSSTCRPSWAARLKGEKPGWTADTLHVAASMLQYAFDLGTVEFLVTSEFAGQESDPVSVLIDQSARPHLQPVGNPNSAPPAVWRLAQRQHLARTGGPPQIAIHARGKVDGARWFRGDTSATEPTQETRLPDSDTLVGEDGELPWVTSAGDFCNGMPGFMMCAQFFWRPPPPPAGRRALESPAFGGFASKVHHN